METKYYKLLGEDGKEYKSTIKGELGGYNGKEKIYGRLDCPSALSWIAKGYYVDKRVFFKDEYTAIKAGFRPCGCCMKDKYLEWKCNPDEYKNKIISQYDSMNEDNVR